MGASVLQGYRLSPQQRRLWSLLQGDAAACGARCAIEIDGPLDVERLDRALSGVAARHESLRTRFDRLPGMPLPLQVVAPAEPGDGIRRAEYRDLSSLPAAARDELVESLWRQVPRRDLARGPLLHALLVALAPRRHLLLLGLPALCADAASLAILAAEIAALYAGGEDGGLGAAVQLADVAEWLNEAASSAGAAAEGARWQPAGRAAGGAPGLAVTAVPAAGWDPAAVPVPLPADLARRCGGAAAAADCLLACWLLLLARREGRRDLLLGLRCEGRGYAELHGVIGPLATVVPLAVEIDEEMVWSDLLERVRGRAAAAAERQELFSWEAGARLGGGGARPQAVYLRYGFALERRAEPAAARQTCFRLVRSRAWDDRFDVRLTCRRDGGRLLAELHFDRRALAASDALRLAGQLALLAQNAENAANAAARPAARAASLGHLGEAELHLLLREWNDTATDLAPECLHEMFARQAARTPACPAVACEETELTYAELAARAGRLARRLRRLGVGPEVFVAVHLERSLEMAVAVLAVLAAGGAYFPLDPADPPGRLAFLRADAAPALLLTVRRWAAGLDRALPMVLLDEAEGEEEQDDGAGLAAAPPLLDSPAYLIYTSGSTGRPKGVVISHRGIVNRLLWMQRLFPLAPGDRVLQKTPASFDASVWELLLPLLAGATVVMARPGGHRDSRYLVEEVARRRITVLQLVPSMLRALLAEPDLAPCAGLRRLFCGGEALPLELQRLAFSRLGCELHNLYGPTEASIDVCSWPCRRDDEQTMVRIGRPIANSRVYLLDPRLRPVAPAARGELYAAGPGLARGYHGRPELTAERFLPDPFSAAPGGRMYRTGDLACWLADGSLAFLGRADQQVKLRGFRIELGEIEAVLLEQPAVAAAVVTLGEAAAGGQRLCAHVVPAAGRAPRGPELQEALRARLPEHMVPVAFRFLDSLPRMPSGKVDRTGLARHVPAPEAAAEAARPALTPLEEILAGMWAELLGVDRIGPADDFFELGGHSLLATRLMSRLRHDLALQLPARRLFEAPVLADFAVEVGAAMGQAAPDPAAPIIAEARPEHLPLSFAQERLWFLEQFEPETARYCLPAAIDLAGQLRVDALRASLSAAAQRHEALRTVFRSHRGVPVQLVLPPAPAPCVEVDLRGLGPAARAVEIDRLGREMATRPFDLERGPLLRTCLLTLAAERHRLLITLHHLVSDGWSTGVLIEELAALYQAHARGDRPALPPLPIQYADFALWQRRALGGTALADELAYWRRRLACLPVLELPLDQPRRRGAGAPRGRRDSFRVALAPPALAAFGRRCGATLFMALLAVFKTLLLRYSGQSDIVVGSPIANRRHGELEGLIGFFVNSLVLRTDLGGNPTMFEACARVRETALGAYAHQDLPFERLVEELQPERRAGENPLFQVVFAVENAPRARPALAGLELSAVELPTYVAKFDLFFDVWERADGCECVLEYNADLFAAASIARLAGHYGALLAAAAARPEARLAELPLLAAAELHQLLVEANDTLADYPRDATIPELFAAVVRRQPEAVAVEQGETRLTYRELDRHANRLAWRLRRAGVGPEVLVGICLERSPDLAVALLAILKAGGAYVPLDPSHPRARLALLLADTRLPVLLTEEPLLPRLPVHAATVILLDAERRRLAGESALPAASGAGPLHLAYVTYTSGSTGRPKGVAIPHRGVLRLARGGGFARLGSGETHLLFAPLAFDASTFEIWGCLLNGGRLVVAPSGPLAIPELAGLVAAAGVTTLWLTASLFNQLRDSDLEGLGGLRQLLAGGDVLAPAQVRMVAGRLAGCRVINGYGPTESTTFAACFPVAGPPAPAGAVPLGRPIGNTQVLLLDAALSPVPPGAPGDLYIGGDGLARGYLNRPELTAERFLPHPFPAQPGERLYCSGDRARRRPGGLLDFLGRRDGQVKIRGHRVEPGETEEALRGHPQVAAAAVVAVGEGERQLVAYVAGMAEWGALREWLAARLPDYMVPALWVRLGELPLSPNGKVDRRALAARGLPAAQSAAASAGGAEGEPAAPRGEIEELLAELFAEGLGRGRVGREESFFELGGHSLLATRLVSRVREACGVELTLRALFAAPTPAALASAVTAGLGGAAAPERITPAARQAGGAVPLSFAQQRLWFLEQRGHGEAVLNIPFALRLTGALDLGLLRRAVAELVRRHEALRTTFPSTDGRAGQRTAPAVPPPLPLIDLTACAEERELARLLRATTLLRFDLAAGPLLRLLAVRLDAAEHVVLLVLHHIVGDGWSMGVMAREVSALYRAFARGEPSPLPALPIQYADFALWQRGWLRGAVLDSLLAYWTAALAGRRPPAGLPGDRPRPRRPSQRGVTLAVALPEPLSAQLLAFSRREGLTPFMCLLAAFFAWIRGYTGEDDVVVGTDVANRNRLESEGLVGFFVNQLALRAAFAPRATWRDLLAQVRETALGAFVHQDLPFDLLVDALRRERGGGAGLAPLFRVKLIFQNAPAYPLELPGVAATPLAVERGTAPLDLVLALWPASQGLAGWCNYSSDLFAAPTVERMLARFAAVLEHLVTLPEATFEDLDQALARQERRQQTMQADKLAQASLHKFKSIKPRAVALAPDEALVRTRLLAAGATLPLVIEPAVEDLDLPAWAQGNRAWLDGLLARHGALLLRGFGVDSVASFAALSLSFCRELCDDNGEHEAVEGSVQTPVFYPPDQKLLWHNENSFNHRWPTRILFCCAVPPEAGGETPLVDSRRLLAELAPELVARFRQRQVIYQRNYDDRVGRGWQAVFRTGDREAVESACRLGRMDLDWQAGGRLRTRALRPAVVRHPATGEWTWFNQAQHWHVSCLAPATRGALSALYAEDDLPRHCYYGDGSAIADEDMAAILDAYRRLEVSFSWQKGDVLVLDNLLAAHARNPFAGPRKILVTLGDMSDYDELARAAAAGGASQ
jgi:amino acid adenylation domain-containing protein